MRSVRPRCQTGPPLTSRATGAAEDIGLRPHPVQPRIHAPSARPPVPRSRPRNPLHRGYAPCPTRTLTRREGAQRRGRVPALRLALARHRSRLRRLPPPPPPRTNWTRLVPPSVLIGHAWARRGRPPASPRALLHRSRAGVAVTNACACLLAPILNVRACLFVGWADVPRPPPPSRTDWTRLVPPPVLTGHVS